MGDSINICEKSVLERYIHCNSAHITPPALSIIQTLYNVKFLERSFCGPTFELRSAVFGVLSNDLFVIILLLQFFSYPSRVFSTVNDGINSDLVFFNSIVDCERKSFGKKTMILLKMNAMYTCKQFKRFNIRRQGF